MDLKASQDRNQILFSQFASYYLSLLGLGVDIGLLLKLLYHYKKSKLVDVNYMFFNDRLVQLANEAQEKEIQSLKSIVDELNKKLLEKEEKQHENEILVAKMKDDLVVLLFLNLLSNRLNKIRIQRLVLNILVYSSN